jgi:hypothetical protein
MLRKAFLFSALVVFVLLVVAFWPPRTSKRLSAVTSSTEPETSRNPTANHRSNDLAIPGRAASTASKIQRFEAWTENFLKTPAPKQLDDLVSQGLELAHDRRTELARLIRKDPKAALEAAVPMAVRQQLPKSVQDQLEERVSGRGFYGVLIATDFENGTNDIRREVILNNQSYQAYVYGKRKRQTTQQKAPLWGIAVPNQENPAAPKLLAVSEEPVRPIEPGEKVPVAGADPLCPVSNVRADSLGTEALAEVGGRIERFCMVSHISKLNDRLAADVGGSTGASEPGTARDSWSQGPKTLLFMRVAFPDDPGEPIGEDEAYQHLDELNQWYIEGSYNTTQVTPTVTPLLMLPYPKSFYSVQGTGRLLSDARDAARAQAGLDTDNFTWDMVRHPSVPGPGFGYGGLAYVRGKGIWLQSSSTGVACHELGHNYGLWHANSWTADNDSVIGPGTHVEYGNSYDTMGAANAGANHFNASFKNQLDWLPETFVHTVTSNGTYRIYTFDSPSIVSGQKYAIKVRKNYDRDYWAEFRQRFTHRWFLSGVLLNWDPWDNGVSDSAGGTHYLDTTPGTPDGKNDGPVVVGRTFSDFPAGVHITPVARSGSGDPWIDVVVNLGVFPDNLPPVASLIADRTSAGPGVNVNFSVSAFDPDGDELAYAWDFGDATFGPNAPSVAKNWTVAGEYTVRCTVSDMKGGLFTQKATITVGSSTTFRVSGRVVANDGTPLEGVRVHNGQTGTNYHGTYTDSDGYYVLPNNLAGNHTISAVKYGYTLNPSGWANPIVLGPNAVNRDFLGVPVPVVAILASDPQASEASANTGEFLITRTGPTNVALVVKMNRSGTATLGTDYSLTPAPSGAPLQVTIPVGAASLPITVTPVNDSTSEGPETVVLTLMEDSAYVLGSLAEAVVTIADDESPTIPTVDVSASNPQLQADNLATESGPDSAVFTFTRSGSVAGELTVYYSVGGTATPDVDYQALSGVITIPAGHAMATLPFRVIDDIEVENNETVTVTILPNSAYNGAGDNTSITIVDDDLTTLFVTATDDTARESNASAGTFVISRVGRLDMNLVVNYTIEGTATPGADYPALSGSVTIPAGRATVNIPVTAINDGLMEGEETVILRLDSSVSYNVGNPGSATITIVDDEGANVSLAASDANAAEAGLDPGAFTFTRAGGNTNLPLIVYFRVDGTAAPGIDYVALPDFITIPIGSRTFVLPVTPIDDTFFEDQERVILTLLPSPDYSVTTVAPQFVTITSNDGGIPAVGFTRAESSGLESLAGPVISVSLSSNSLSTVTVNYAVTGGSATGGGVDYTLAAGTLTFLPGTNNQSIRITVVNDTLVETNETIRITLSNPVNAVLDAITTHTYTIIDDDRSGNVTVAAIPTSISEASPTPAAFRISRSGSTASNLTVGFQILGSASSPTDYLPIPDSVTIPAGATFVDIPVTPVNDDTDETNETVTINLLNAVGGRIASPDTATITIIDDDNNTNLPVVTVVATDPLASEPGADTGTFTISRQGDTSSDLTVTFTVGGTAGAGDFTPIGTSAIIPAGASETIITITPIDDALFETNETVVLTLTQLPSYRVGLDASATVTIEDNEIGVSIVSDGNSAEDGSSTGSFVITRTGSLASDLTVFFTVAGTATRTNDYAGFGTSVTIPAGTNVVTIPVDAVNDTLPEGTESVVLTLITGSGYVARPPATATVLIFDDEPVVTIVATDDTAREPNDNGLFTIARGGSIAGPLTVGLTIGGTASNGVDYVALPNQITFAAGQSSTNLPVIVIDDLDTEGSESVSITIKTNAAYSVGLPGSAVVTIADNEINLPPTVQILSPKSDVVFLATNNLFLVLEARVLDDGRPNPPALVTSLWTRVSGPATVAFGNATSTNTFARFTASGVYVLRLAAGDGQLQTSTDLTVIVNATASLQTGLQAYWHFDQTNGTTTPDSSGNNRPGTVNGATFTTAGRFDHAFDFDGVNDLISFSSPVASQVSISAWVFSEGNGNSTTPRVIAMPGYNMRVRRADAAIAFESERTTTAYEWRSPLNSYGDNAWHHLVLAYDSATTTPAIYIDGMPQTVTLLVTGSGTPIANTGTGYIGNQAALDRGLDGRIDEVRLYNRLLTALEAQTLAYGPSTNVSPNVEAGPNRTVSGGAAALLSGSVTDDGQPNPPGALSNSWSKFSGPGTVTFANPRAASTTATFSDVGTYVLSLTSDDGQVKVFDQMTVTVVDAATVTVQTTATPAAEFGAVPATFTITREGPTNVVLNVFFSLSGTASNGVDYSAVAGLATIQVGASNVPVTIAPILDALAEGDETVMITLITNSAYVLGSASNASLTISDRPYDAWRFARFNAGELGDPIISGDQGDPDNDRLKNLLEYAFHLDPKTWNPGAGFSGSIQDVGLEGRLFQIAYTRLKAPRDIDYTLEVSTDLSTWNSGPGFTQELTASDDGNGVTETVYVKVIAPLDQPGQRFVRLRVTKQ